MNIGTCIYIKLFGKLVDKDELGNSYYIMRQKDSFGRNKRVIKYKGKPDPTLIPPRFHAWIHYLCDKPLSSEKYSWEKPNLGNLTGTTNAYFPPGHIVNGAKRDKASADYVAWKP